MLHAHHWTLEEANAACPYVGRCVARLRAAQGRLGDGAPAGLAMVAGGAWAGREHAAAAVEVVLTLEQLDRLEIIVRDLEAGLIDFPAMRDGEEIYLCWLVDEPGITHWHAPGTGFPSRRPL
jgi:hypothetical protein